MASAGGHWARGSFLDKDMVSEMSAGYFAKVKSGRAASRFLASMPLYASFNDIRLVWGGANLDQRRQIASKFPGYAARLDPDTFGWKGNWA